MNDENLRTSLRHLIDAYVEADDAKQALLALLERDEVPVKGILADITPHLGRTSPADTDLLQEIVYFYL